MRVVSILILALIWTNIGICQVKTISTLRSEETIHIDGNLDETAWSGADVATEFITNSPVFGKKPEHRTEVKLVYDNSAIYVGAYIYDDPSLIRKQFTARDLERQADVDYFSIFLDTYNDHQNAFQFLVTSRNVQSDARISPNAPRQFGVYGDLSWDAVWESKISFKDDGWVVEMKIPYFSLRFSDAPIQHWGIQFMRFNRRLNETSFWSPVNPAVNGFVNQFGEVKGLENLRSPLRLSFSPYVSGGYRSDPHMGEPNRNEWLRSGGMDVKYGISESFTLDATLIPDFGQVVSDNVVNNISPFEIQFKENRPFFTEGTELFNKAGIFYSRRIGKQPDGYKSVDNLVGNGDYTDYEIIRNPSVTRLYNAVKLSGRTKNNLGIGIFNAVAQPAKAKIRNGISGRDSLILTEHLTNYNVIVLDQALKNRSFLTLTNTNVLREGAAPDANVTAVDLALYDRKNMYGFFLSPRYSKVFGENEDYEGYKNTVRFAKVSGNLQFSVENSAVSPRYSPNDLGYLQSPNDITNTATVSYNIFEATKYFINQSYGITAEHNYLYKPFEFKQTEISAFGFWIFRNFWDLRVTLGTSPSWFNDFFELQTPENIMQTPRMKLKRAPYYYLFLVGSTDSRKRLYASWNIGAAEGPLPNDPYLRTDISLRYRFSDRFTMEALVERQYDHGQFGYAFVREPGTGDPILARRRYTDFSTILTGIYNFTSRMNLSFRARHYWNKLANTNLYDVLPDGYWNERNGMNPSDYNSNYNAFNLDLFYTWDFRLGSRIILGWKNWLGTDYERQYHPLTNSSYFNNAKSVFNSPHGNEITLRFIYFLDAGGLKR